MTERSHEMTASRSHHRWFRRLAGLAFLLTEASLTAATNPTCLTIVTRTLMTNHPGLLSAAYYARRGLRLLAPAKVSDDNARMWSPLGVKPDFTANLRQGYRREPARYCLRPVKRRGRSRRPLSPAEWLTCR